MLTNEGLGKDSLRWRQSTCPPEDVLAQHREWRVPATQHANLTGWKQDRVSALHLNYLAVVTVV